MTCIVGLVEKGHVYLGGDSAGVGGYNIRIRKDPKVFFLNKGTQNKMVLGYTTSFRMGQILRFGFEVPKHPKGMETYEYLCTHFVNGLIKVMTKQNYAKVHDNEIEGGSFLIGYQGRLFSVQADFQIGEVEEPYDATGCAESYAMGAMHQLIKTNLSPTKKVTAALQTSAHFSAGVCAPFLVLKL